MSLLIGPDIPANPNFSGFVKHGQGWRDLVMPFSSARGRGTSEPVWSDIGNGLYAMLFTAGDQLFTSFHVDHDYAPGSKAYPHIHWFSSSPILTGQTVTWRFLYQIAKGHSQGESLTATAQTIDIGFTAAKDYIAGEHIVSECSDLDAFLLIEPDTIILVGVELLSENLTGDIFGVMSDIHFLSDREVTLNKAPNFNS